jgi:hypothetical protein
LMLPAFLVIALAILLLKPVATPEKYELQSV